MQLSELQRRKASVPKFTNHTLRPWEITSAPTPAAPTPSQSPIAADGGPDPLFRSDMVGSRPTYPGMTIGAGPLYSHASIMGQTPSAQQRGPNHSNTILREDSIIRQVEEVSYDDDGAYSVAASGYTLPPLSREDSWSIHYADTNQAPYSNAATTSNDRMITQSSLLRLPADNASRDLALFLRTTGPVAPQRRPSKIEPEPPRRAVSAPKNALRFLKLGGGNGKRQVTPVKNAHERLNGMLRDEGGLLEGGGHRTPQTIPKGYEQKISSTGKPYLALQTPSQVEKERHQYCSPSQRNILEPEVLESRVSVCFHEEGSMSDVLDSYLSSLSKEQSIASSHHDLADERPATSYEEVANRLAKRFPTPIRSAASNPPTPVPESAISRTESYHSGMFGPATARPSVETTRSALTYTTRNEDPQTPKISLPKEEFPVKHPSPEKEVEIKHPLPRRLGSHPVLLQRASSLASTLYPSRSVSDSPGPPPPRSPLRPRKDPRSIESIITTAGAERNMTPRTAPSIRSGSEFDFGAKPIRATVTTECSGPIKRPKSRDKNGNSPRRMPYPMNRREREERLRARKRPIVNRTIDSVVHAPANATRQRLKKMRPQIQIPDIRPQPLRAPSAASSVSSWQKVTQSTLTPISPVPSEATDISQGEEDKTGYTPISPTASAEARAMEVGMGLSPVMLVAEQVPVPKTKSPPKPARLILKESKSKPYAPRPRSASMSRTALKRRSKSSPQNQSLHSSPRGKSPTFDTYDLEDEAPPLPSPPPNRALPPTPPASGSEKTRKANSKAKVVAVDRKTQLSPLPSHEVSPIDSSFSRADQQHRFPHVITQQQQSRSKYPSRSMSSRIDARLEALEKQNQLLSAALMAVLQTNGALNGPLPGLQAPESPVNKGPMAWESRVARRSAATSHTASSSNGSALEMYMSTRRGSRHGY